MITFRDISSPGLPLPETVFKSALKVYRPDISNPESLQVTERSSFKCKCGWIGYNPLRMGVNSGLSSDPVRYLCPQCLKQHKYSKIGVNRINPIPGYYLITDPESLVTKEETVKLLNFPAEMASIIYNRIMQPQWEKAYDSQRKISLAQKRNIDEYIRAVNG